MQKFDVIRVWIAKYLAKRLEKQGVGSLALNRCSRQPGPFWVGKSVKDGKNASLLNVIHKNDERWDSVNKNPLFWDISDDSLPKYSFKHQKEKEKFTN